jgi:preprotein translocase subunit SecB
MAENGTNGQEPAGAAQAQGGIQLLINAQYLKDLSFENPRAPQSLIQPKGQPEVQLSVDVKANTLAQDVYEVTLTMAARAVVEGEPVFVVELSYAAVATAKAEDPNLLPILILVEVPRIIFPFARSIVANATRDGGFPPLLLNPIDFTELLRQQQNAAQAGQTATA